MTSPERAALVRAASAALALLLCALVPGRPLAPPLAPSMRRLPNPCDLPVVTNVCGAVGSAASSVASATGEFVMRGVTEWVTDAAVWVTGKVGDLVNSTTSPDLTASWFQGEYGAMLAVAGALALLMLMLAVIQSVHAAGRVDADSSRVRLPADGVHPRRRSPSPRPGSSSRSRTRCPPPW